MICVAVELRTRWFLSPSLYRDCVTPQALHSAVNLSLLCNDKLFLGSVQTRLIRAAVTHQRSDLSGSTKLSDAGRLRAFNRGIKSVLWAYRNKRRSVHSVNTILRSYFPLSCCLFAEQLEYMSAAGGTK